MKYSVLCYVAQKNQIQQTLLTTTKLSLNCEHTIFSRCCTKCHREKKCFCQETNGKQAFGGEAREPVAAEWRTNHVMTRAHLRSGEHEEARRQERDKPKYATEIRSKRTNFINRRSNLAHRELGDGKRQL